MTAQHLAILLQNWASGRGSLYQRLSAAIEQTILPGGIRSGDRLPSERALAKALTVSRSTVIAAYQQLRESNWVESRRGSGTRVCQLSNDARNVQAGYRSVHLASNPVLNRNYSEPDTLVDLSIISPPMPHGLLGFSTQSLAAEYDYHPMGLPALRLKIAEHFTQNGIATDPNQILVTTGAQQAIFLVASSEIERNDHVMIEDPTYFGAIDAFRLVGARLVPIPVKVNGMCLETFARSVEASVPRLVYLTPAYHNPTGAIMPEASRREIARITDQANILVLEDATFANLSLDAGNITPPPIAQFVERTPVVTVGTLSKLVWAGLRVGWLRAPESMIARLARIKTACDIGSAFPSQAIAVETLSNLDSFISLRRSSLTSQRDRLCALLHHHLSFWTWQSPSGGAFLWVQLPYGDAQSFHQWALRYGVIVTPGTTMSISGQHIDFIRISFSLGLEYLNLGVERLAQAWATYQPPFIRQQARGYTV